VPTIQQILKDGTKTEQLALFKFNSSHSNEIVIFKFNLWARKFFGKYFKSKDAFFHKDLDLSNLKVYRGQAESFTDGAFRGAAKTARTKLFIAYVIANDEDHFRRYFKVLSADGNNSKQIVTDIYNMFVTIKGYYPDIFEKTETKREEQMGSFTTSTGVKIVADTVGTSQRGAIQEDSRPDFIWFDDFENRIILRSLVKVKMIWDNMEEARTGLAKNGGAIYTCNYISESGNVHKIMQPQVGRIIMNIPIWDENHIPAWPEEYDVPAIQIMQAKDEDFEGERLGKPSASKDILFDRETLDNMKSRLPVRTVSNFKMFYLFDPSHRYGSGHDVAGGVGLDSSTSVFIDFSTMPARVVATYADNLIKPEVFGDEIKRESDYYGEAIAGIENNRFDTAVYRARIIGVNLYTTKKQTNVASNSISVTYGWNTNALTKSKMLFALSKAISDGLLDLSDEALISEAKSYTRNDLMDEVKDPRLTTRHFDLLIACAIAWQMKDEAQIKQKNDYQQQPYQATEYEGKGSVRDFQLVSTPEGGQIILNNGQTYQQAPIDYGELEY